MKSFFQISTQILRNIVGNLKEAIRSGIGAPSRPLDPDTQSKPVSTSKSWINRRNCRAPRRRTRTKSDTAFFQIKYLQCVLIPLNY